MEWDPGGAIFAVTPCMAAPDTSKDPTKIKINHEQCLESINSKSSEKGHTA